MVSDKPACSPHAPPMDYTERQRLNQLIDQLRGHRAIRLVPEHQPDDPIGELSALVSDLLRLVFELETECVA